MDWKTIKNIMIFALIFLNLFLGYNIYSSGNRFVKKVAVETDVYQKVVEILEEKNIFVDVDLQYYQSLVPSISLEYESYKEEDIKKFFDGNEYEKIERIFIGNDKFVKINDDTSIEWFLIDPGDNQNYTTSINAEKIANEFLKKYEYYTTDIEPWKIYFNKGNVVVEYRQKYKDFFLDPTYMILEINNDRVISFSRKWYSSIKEGDVNRIVISPSEALFKLIENSEEMNKDIKRNEKIVINRLELGYKLDDNIFFSSIKSGDPLPYWRISMGNNKVIYVEAIKQ